MHWLFSECDPPLIHSLSGEILSQLPDVHLRRRFFAHRGAKKRATCLQVALGLLELHCRLPYTIFA